MADDITLELDAFIRSIGVNKASQYALLLGAGASISSGIPSASSCIWEWKRSIFLTNNPGLENQFSELSLPSVRTKIQQWLDSQRTYPALDSSEEYSFFINTCYPIAEDRKSFFQDKVRQAVPHTGYRLVVALAEAGLIQSVWTTNFDSLTARAAASSKVVSAIEVGIDSQERIFRRPNRNELVCVGLHGDYRYDALKNTSAELQAQERTLRDSLVETSKDTPLLVVGYSGRDASLMAALYQAYSQRGTGGLYWCGFGDGEMPSAVRDLINYSRSNGRAAFYVQSGGFDDLMLRIALHCLEGEGGEKARQIIAGQSAAPTEERVEFTLASLPTCGVIKSNAFPLTPPSEIYEFELREWPEPNTVWDYFRTCTDGKSIVAAPFKGKAYAFGTIDDIRMAFSQRIGEKIERVPISDIDLKYEDGAMSSLIRCALVRAMAERAGVNSDGREFLWLKSPRERKQEGGKYYLIHDAVVVYLRRIAGKSYVILKPTVWVGTTTGEEVPEDVERNLKLAILGWQHNNKFNQALDLWRNLLFKNETFEFPTGCGSPFRIGVRRAPIMARVMSPDRNRQIQVLDKFKPLIVHSGIELREPDLIFSNKAGTGTSSDPHPVRGIIQNRPFDFALTTRHLGSPIQVAVICPASESRRLNGYLQQLHQSIDPGRSEGDYLMKFDGFQNAFATQLRIPSPGDNLWQICPDMDLNMNAQSGALQLSQHITTCLNALKASALPNVTIIYIPTKWAKWWKFETATESFDVHNFVKAFCVPQGIATQFLEEDTLDNPLQCRIRWWLSLALYVKSMRTPWVLSSLDSESAFVGLGIGIDRKAERGKHVMLGCSHLYNAQGQGLQFRLSKIENPVMRGKNAFMSHDDARRVGETIRQLFWGQSVPPSNSCRYSQTYTIHS